jgi:hypothetical protein
MAELIYSKHVMEFPLDAFGTKSLPAVMPFGQMMHGSSTSGAEVEVVVVEKERERESSAGAVVVSTSLTEVEEVVVVATVVSSSGIGVGEGVTSGGQQSDSSISP